MMIHIKDAQYPVTNIIDELKSSLGSENTVILSAPPGAGKSTVLPLLLLDMPFLNGKKIIMLEPRRIAAVSIASRMSMLMGEKPGETIGYRVRFDTKVSSKTRIEVVTEAILEKMLVNDSLLEDVGMIIFDEFHERNIHSDISLAMCREVQSYLRDDLRILIMSATLNLQSLSDVLKAPVIKSEGKCFPVKINYCEPSVEDSIAKQTAKIILKSLNNDFGDILAFLPGEYDILKCKELLESNIHLDDILIYPLYGQIATELQQKAIIPDEKKRRKIVLATSIAETSLTIEGVRVVVDSGYTRKMKYNLSAGLSRLETVRISLDMAEQRAGRAGRLSEGICYRLWSMQSNHSMMQHRVPEIEEAELSSMLLELYGWGIKDIYSLQWLSLPPKKAYYKAKELLIEINAICNDTITDYGKQLLKIAAHPRLANMLLKGKSKGVLSLACDIAAVLESRDPMYGSADSDINSRIENLRRYRKRLVTGAQYASIEKIASSYRKIFNADVDNNLYAHDLTGYLIACAFPERIAKHISNSEFKLSNGVVAKFKEAQDLSGSEWIAVAAINGDEKRGDIISASSVDLNSLVDFMTYKEILRWDPSERKVISRRDTVIGKIVVKSEILHNPDSDKVKAILCNEIEKNGENLLEFNEDVKQWQCRISSLAKWAPELGLPDVSTCNLLANCSSWLMPYLDNITKADDLKKIDLVEILKYSLEWEQLEYLDNMAPEKIEVPSGSKIKLIYNSEGLSPILSVRLQECFGMGETPKLCNGKVSVIMHLLSPGFKPVQITSDLKSFWNNTYNEVKKELKRRYPKHSWPDNPCEAAAVRGVKRNY